MTSQNKHGACVYHPPALPFPLRPLVFLLSPDLPIPECRMNWIMQHVVTCDWLLSPRLMFFQVHPCCSVNQNFTPYCGRTLLCCKAIYTAFILFIRSPGDGHLVYFQIFLSQIMLLWSFTYKFLHGHTFSFLLGRYLRVQVLGHMETLMFNFCEIVRLLFQVSASIQCLHTQFKQNLMSSFPVNHRSERAN